MADSWCPCFMPWLLFLGLWLSSSMLSPPLASFLPAVTCVPGFIPGFQIELLFFKKLFPFFYFWLIADISLMLCPLPLAMTLTNWKSLIKGWWLTPWMLWLCSSAMMTSFVWPQQWYFLFLCYRCSCALHALLSSLLNTAFFRKQGLYSTKN